jgi:hypothetical protein
MIIELSKIKISVRDFRTTNKPMAQQFLRGVSQFVGLRPNHVCEVSR